MALTNTLVFASAGGDRRMHVWKCTFDSSYTTGGEALTAADLGFNDHPSLLTVICNPSGPNSFGYDATNQKLLSYSDTGETAADENLSAVTATLQVFGKDPAI